MKIDRRNFIRSATGVALLKPLNAQNKPAAGRALMKAGTQHDSSDDALPVMAAFGVEHICSSLPSPHFDQNWSPEALGRLRERIEKYGIKLDMVPLPMSSNYITKFENPNILLGKSPLGSV